MEQLKKEEEKFKDFERVMGDIDKLVEKFHLEENVKQVKARVCNLSLKEYKYRLIVLGCKNGKQLDKLVPNEVVFVSALKDATHIVSLNDKLTDTQERIYAKVTHL